MKTMKSVPALFLAGAILLTLAVSVACQPATLDSISGRVVDSDGAPVPGAVVRVKATDPSTATDAEGRFTLAGLDPDMPVFVTAWAAGYYINGVADVMPRAVDVEIVLHTHHDTDNPDYAWLPSTYHEGQGENQGCAECHSAADSPLPLGEGAGVRATLPVDEWLLDAHSQSAVNPRFLTMYTGTDLEGNRSPLTRYGYNRDYGRFPLRPDPNQPYFGPGYKLDFPDTAGNCAACHTPAAAINTAYGVDPTSVTGVESEGVPCDFCHKVWDVNLNAATGLPYPNMPGVLSFEFRRPPEGHQFFAGPFDDVAPGEDTYTPIQRQGQYCAPCHFGIFWDTTIYNSFGEWLDSPYSDPERAKTAGLSSSKSCQDCHMPHLGATYFALPDKGAVERDPETIFSHLMPGASDEALLQNAVTMKVKAKIEGGQVIVNVEITNDKTGHHVPTDSPLRQMILLVNAVNGQGQALPLRAGPTIPEWGGVGDPTHGYYAGLPGKIYAKILMELWTEITPSGAYWNPTRIVSDNRIPALGSDSSTFVFAAPAEGPARIEVRLLFRRAFIELMEQKGWDVPDIIMEQETLYLP